MDTIDPVRFILAFIFVMGLIGAMGFGVKKYGHKLAGGKWFMMNMKDEGGRLAVLEVRWIDPKRKLALVRRDNVEHLLLISDKGEQVIESGIKHEK